MEKILSHESDNQLLENPPSVHLHFFRHDEKGANPLGTDESDHDVRLTEQGRKQAAERSPYWNQWHAKAGTFVFGSPRERSLETALLRAYPETAIHSTMEETKTRISEVFGRNIKLDKASAVHHSGKVKNWSQTENLNFAFGTGDMRPLYDKHYLQDKDLLHYVYNSSDADLIRTGDESAKSYSLYAAGTAKEVLRATKVLSTMVRQDSKREGLLQNRFYGSHQSVTECFVLKVLEKMRGQKAAQDFLSKLTSKQGFDFSEGFEVRVTHEGDESAFELEFRKEVIPFSLEILEQIIREGEMLETLMQAGR